jgi:hypothetical protein
MRQPLDTIALAHSKKAKIKTVFFTLIVHLLHIAVWKVHEGFILNMDIFQKFLLLLE